MYKNLSMENNKSVPYNVQDNAYRKKDKEWGVVNNAEHIQLKI